MRVAIKKSGEFEQISAIRKILSASRCGDEFAKKIVFFLLDKTEGLASEVRTTLREGEYSPEVILSLAVPFRQLVKEDHLNEILRATGSGLSFWWRYGWLDEDGKFHSHVERFNHTARKDNASHERLALTCWIAQRDDDGLGRERMLSFNPDPHDLTLVSL